MQMDRMDRIKWVCIDGSDGDPAYTYTVVEVKPSARRPQARLAAISHNQRLRERLERLALDVVTMAGDGNCQVRYRGRRRAPD